jgi:hypothetical protein
MRLTPIIKALVVTLLLTSCVVRTRVRPVVVTAPAGVGCDESNPPTKWPWVNCYGSISTMAKKMRAVFDAHGMAGKPMLQTEGGWGNGSVTNSDTQVTWIGQWLLLQAGLARPLNMLSTSWFAWAGYPYAPDFQWGRIQVDSQTPNAAGLAMGRLFTWLTTMGVEPCATGLDGTVICPLDAGNGYHGEAVWTLQPSATFRPGAPFVQGGAIATRDLYGVVNATPGHSITITPQPLIVESCTGTCTDAQYVKTPSDGCTCECPAYDRTCRGCPLDGTPRPWGCPQQDPITCAISYNTDDCPQ